MTLWVPVRSRNCKDDFANPNDTAGASRNCNDSFPNSLLMSQNSSIFAFPLEPRLDLNGSHTLWASEQQASEQWSLGDAPPASPRALPAEARQTSGSFLFWGFAGPPRKWDKRSKRDVFQSGHALSKELVETESSTIKHGSSIVQRVLCYGRVLQRKSDQWILDEY